MNWRGLTALGSIVAILALLAGYAWLTQNPAAGILEEAESWPWIGPLASRFRQAYLPPEPSPSGRSPAIDKGPRVVVIQPQPEDVQASPYVWVQPGSKLYEGPDRKSAVLQTVTSIRNLSIVEQRGDWYRVRVHRTGERSLLAWVWLEDYQDPSPQVLRQPEPVLPLPAKPADPERISAARQLMEKGGMQVDCGLYPMFTDAVYKALVERCPRVTQGLEDTYRQRYGLEPVSPPAEAIFLFRRVPDYRLFRDREQVPFASNRAHASPAAGYVALYQGERSLRDILGTLVHELTHLLNRRSLGPALPSWLNEGIADDLADSRMGEDGSIDPGELGGESGIQGRRVTRRGGVAAAIHLQDAMKDDDLPTLAALIEMDRQQFHEPGRAQLHYALSSFWVRYLLSGVDPDLKVGFRAFLQDVGNGEPLTEEQLLERLGRDWQDLEPGFRNWLRLQFLTPPSETRDESL